MACGAILRRKLIPNINSTISASARLFESRAARSQIGFITTTTPQHVRYACTNTFTTPPKQASSTGVVLRILPTMWNTILGIGRTVKVGLHMTRIKNSVESEAEVRKACTDRGMHVAEERQQQMGAPKLNNSPMFHTKVGFSRGFCSSSISPSPVDVFVRRNKKMGPLACILNELKDVPRPYPQTMFPSAYLKRGVPNHEIVKRDGTHYLPTGCSIVYELMVDVWPFPDCFIIHGIWPSYICGHWLVSYRLEKMDEYQMYLLKTRVKQEILQLDESTKQTLHEIWKSSEDLDEETAQNMDFWAYQKVIHCWDLLGCPQGQHFTLMAWLGKYVRESLRNWIEKSNCTPNRLHQSKFIRTELRKLFGVAVFLVVKADDCVDFDPDCTYLPFLHSLAFMVEKDPTQLYGYYLFDHPSGLTKVPTGEFFFLM